MAAPDYATELDNLRTALSGGELEIRAPDGSYTRYGSAEDLMRRIRYLEGLVAAGGGTPASRTTYAEFSRR